MQGAALLTPQEEGGRVRWDYPWMLCPLDIAIELAGRAVGRSTVIPTRRRVVFGTAREGQGRVVVRVFEGLRV